MWWESFGGYLGSCSGRLEAILRHLELSWSIFDVALDLSGDFFGTSLLAEAIWRSVSLLGAVKVDGP